MGLIHIQIPIKLKPIILKKLQTLHHSNLISIIRHTNIRLQANAVCVNRRYLIIQMIPSIVHKNWPLIGQPTLQTTNPQSLLVLSGFRHQITPEEAPPLDWSDQWPPTVTLCYSTGATSRFPLRTGIITELLVFTGNPNHYQIASNKQFSFENCD